MADPAGPTGTKRRSSITNDNPLKYSFDAGFLAGTSSLDDSPESTEFEVSDHEENDQSSESDTESRHTADLASTFRDFSESMLKMELAELRMIKEREALRMEAEKRRMEMENQLTQLMMQTQLQIASFVCQKNSNRKRKRSNNVTSDGSERDSAILMGLLQCNFVQGLDRTR